MSPGRRRLRIILALILVLGPWLGWHALLYHLRTPAPGGLAEASGMVVAATHLGHRFAIADSGQAASLTLLDSQGRRRAEFPLRGAHNQDWEALASDGGRILYVGDIGNWRRDPPDCNYQVYKVTLPEGAFRALDAERWPLRYPASALDGRTCPDAEALFWMSGELYLVAKQGMGRPAAVFRVPATSDAEGLRTLVRAGELWPQGSWWRRRLAQVTGASYHPGRSLLAVSGYTGISVYRVEIEADGALAFTDLRHLDFAAPTLGQCESVAWLGDRLLLGNEQGQIFEFSQASWISQADDGHLEKLISAP